MLAYCERAHESVERAVQRTKAEKHAHARLREQAGPRYACLQYEQPRSSARAALQHRVDAGDAETVEGLAAHLATTLATNKLCVLRK